MKLESLQINKLRKKWISNMLKLKIKGLAEFAVQQLIELMLVQSSVQSVTCPFLIAACQSWWAPAPKPAGGCTSLLLRTSIGCTRKEKQKIVHHPDNHYTIITAQFW